jgi:hypothetical protein
MSSQLRREEWPGQSQGIIGDTLTWRYASLESQERYTGSFKSEPGASSHRERSQQVEIVIVMAAHQPFGLLMNQVYNIVRPQNQAVRIICQPDPAHGRQWGEIEYQGGGLRVLELARMLQLPLVEPIDRSKILLTGKLLPNGTIEKPFGLAVDDILVVQPVPMDNLRLLPDWLCKKRLGKLVWGAALLQREGLEQQSALHHIAAEGLLGPLQVASFEGANVNFDSATAALAELLPPGEEFLPPVFGANSNGIAKAIEKPANTDPSQSRPVVLLDLAALRDIAYGVT